MELSADQSRRLLEMLDRQEILDCIHRYCRGMDRLDRQLVCRTQTLSRSR